MKTSHRIENLNFNLYEKYGIDHFYEAYVYIYNSISIEDANNIEADLIEKFFKIFSVETDLSGEGMYDISFVVGKSKGHTF